MKTLGLNVNRSLLLLALLLLAGCATSTVESRRNERLSVYQSLAPDIRSQVDRGQIRSGMNEDAVYIAWGKPDQVLHSEDADGLKTIWVYYGSYLEEYRRWRYRPFHYRRGYYWGSYPDHDYYWRSYPSAEVIFENGAVKRWRMLPKPG